jgi:hypothetical protein
MFGELWLKSFHQYQLQYDVKASPSRSLKVQLAMNNGPWDTYWSREHYLATNWQTITTNFAYLGTDDPGASLQFHCGNSLVDFYIDNVKLLDLGPVVIVTTNASTYSINAPTGLTATPKALLPKITLHWTDNSSIEQGYKIYYSNANVKPASPLIVSNANSTGALVSGLNLSTTYYFWVDAYSNTLTSADATTQATTVGAPWSQATAAAAFSGRFSHTSVVFNNKIWTIGGADSTGSLTNDVWYSANGTNWSRATNNASFAARYGHTSVVFNNAMWVIGGYRDYHRNDVWYSTNGTNWSHATASAAFTGRTGHTSVVFNNKMWVIGGQADDGSLTNDVWYSSDGTNWIQSTPAAGFPGRMFHTSSVFNNKMWVIGGYNGSYFNDVWYSSDGIKWTKSTTVSARYGPTSTVFNNSLWLIGGYNGSTYFNDVWYNSAP